MERATICFICGIRWVSLFQQSVQIIPFLVVSSLFIKSFGDNIAVYPEVSVILSNAKNPAQGRRGALASVATTGGLSPQRSLTQRGICEIAFSPYGRRTRFFTSFWMTLTRKYIDWVNIYIIAKVLVDWWRPYACMDASIRANGREHMRVWSRANI